MKYFLLSSSLFPSLIFFNIWIYFQILKQPYLNILVMVYNVTYMLLGFIWENFYKDTFICYFRFILFIDLSYFISVLHGWISLKHIHPWCVKSLGEDVDSRTEVTDGYKSPWRYWKSNPDPLQEQKVLFNHWTSPSSFICSHKNGRFKCIFCYNPFLALVSR